jgi:hypothetical protein
VTSLRRVLLVFIAAVSFGVLAGCDRPAPSCDPIIYGDLPCV